MSIDNSKLTIQTLAFHLINEKPLYQLSYGLLINEVIKLYQNHSNTNTEFGKMFSIACINESIKKVSINNPMTIIDTTRHLLNTISFLDYNSLAFSIDYFTKTMMTTFPIFQSKFPNGPSSLTTYLLKGVSISNLENKEFAHSMIHYSSNPHKKNIKNNSIR